jgi:hypothetical protein
MYRECFEKWLADLEIEFIPERIELQQQLRKQNDEKLNSENGAGKNNSEKFPVKSYSLLHVYWSKYDVTKKITDTNKLRLSQEYNFSQNTLKQTFDLYTKVEERKPTSTDLRAVKPFIEALSGAVKMLESRCRQGFEDAEKELKAIEHKYLPKKN